MYHTGSHKRAAASGRIRASGLAAMFPYILSPTGVGTASAGMGQM